MLIVGGGIGQRDVEQIQASSVQSLPYQPEICLRESLSVADVHVVSIGTQSWGMVLPCKVYGAMAVARPILLFGPTENHVAELLTKLMTDDEIRAAFMFLKTVPPKAYGGR